MRLLKFRWITTSTSICTPALLILTLLIFNLYIVSASSTESTSNELTEDTENVDQQSTTKSTNAKSKISHANKTKAFNPIEEARAREAKRRLKHLYPYSANTNKSTPITSLNSFSDDENSWKASDVKNWTVTPSTPTKTTKNATETAKKAKVTRSKSSGAKVTNSSKVTSSTAKSTSSSKITNSSRTTSSSAKTFSAKFTNSAKSTRNTSKTVNAVAKYRNSSLSSKKEVDNALKHKIVIQPTYVTHFTYSDIRPDAGEVERKPSNDNTHNVSTRTTSSQSHSVSVMPLKPSPQVFHIPPSISSISSSFPPPPSRGPSVPGPPPFHDHRNEIFAFSPSTYLPPPLTTAFTRNSHNYIPQRPFGPFPLGTFGPPPPHPPPPPPHHNDIRWERRPLPPHAMPNFFGRETARGVSSSGGSGVRHKGHFGSNKPFVQTPIPTSTEDLESNEKLSPGSGSYENKYSPPSRQKDDDGKKLKIKSTHNKGHSKKQNSQEKSHHQKENHKAHNSKESHKSHHTKEETSHEKEYYGWGSASVPKHAYVSVAGLSPGVDPGHALVEPFRSSDHIEPPKPILKIKKKSAADGLVPLDKRIVYVSMILSWIFWCVTFATYHKWGQKFGHPVPGQPGFYYNKPIVLTIPKDGTSPHLERKRRSLDVNLPGSNWNFTRVLDMIDIAQKTYAGFDWQSLDCQKKVLCELSSRQMTTGLEETGRKITSSISYYTGVSDKVLESLEGLPIPQIIKHYLKEYKEAINQGRKTNTDCDIIYKKCKFSIKELFLNKDGAKKPATT